MVMMKKAIAAIASFILILVLWGCAGATTAPQVPAGAAPAQPSETTPEVSNAEEDERIFLIGMLQILDHPALDAARNGFINGLAEEGFVEGENVQFNHFSAQGDISNANMMAQRLVDDGSDLILGIATQTSQALAATTDTIPIVITAVTDPLTAGLVDSFERPGTNVTGTSDLTPIAQQFELMQRLLPEAQVVGLVYNAGEVNSAIQANNARALLYELGLTYVSRTVTGTADVAQAVESIIEQIDVLYLVTCNTMAAAYITVINIADDFGVPSIAGEEAAVHLGAVITEGVNYYNLGRQTAVMAAQILRGESVPQEMPIQWQDNYDLVINIGAAYRHGIAIPEDLLERATIVEN